MQNNCISLISMILLISLISCKSQYSKIVGKEYIYENSNRKFSVKIIDHKNLIINNIYNCTEISDKFKNISLNKAYKIIKNKIIILNPDQEDIEIPYFDNSNCTFLTTEFRSNVKHFYDGRTIYPDESLYTFPKIDTLNIINDSIYYYKTTKNGSIGFVFKQRSQF